MATNSDSFLLLLAKQIRAIRDHIGLVEKQAGPVGPAGPIGQIGPTGAPGAAGRDGKDGVNGAPGLQGLVGATGKQGPRGPVGAAGSAGKTGPMPRHEWQGTKLRFQLSPTSWGAWVDLKGPRGTAGASGGGGGSSTPGLTLDDIEQVANLLPGDEMLLARDGVLVRVKVTTSGAPDNAVTVNGEFVMVNGEYVTTGN